MRKSFFRMGIKMGAIGCAVVILSLHTTLFVRASPECDKVAGSCKLMDNDKTCADYNLNGFGGALDCPNKNAEGMYMACCTAPMPAVPGSVCNAAGGACTIGSCPDLTPNSPLGQSDCLQQPPPTAATLCCQGVNADEANAAKATGYGTYGYNDPMGGSAKIPEIVARIISKILPVIGALFLAFFVWGGALYLTAGGDDTKVKKARQTLLNAGIGMMIIVGAYAIVYNIISIFGKAIGQ